MKNLADGIAKSARDIWGAVGLLFVATFYVGIALTAVFAILGALSYAAIRLKIDTWTEALARRTA